MVSFIPYPSGAHLEYLFANAAGFELLGSAGGQFALQWEDEGVKRIAVFGGQLPPTHSSFTSDYAHVPLQLAQELGAAFSVDKGTVVCEVGSIRSTGESYAEAAMRALVAHFLAVSAVPEGRAE